MNRHPRSSNRRAARGRDDTTHDTVTGRQREDTGTQAVVADCRVSCFEFVLYIMLMHEGFLKDNFSARRTAASNLLSAREGP